MSAHEPWPRLGLLTPVVTRLPTRHASWEVEAGIEEIARIAAHAEQCGYTHLTCSDHVAIPDEVAQVRGGTYWDPLSVFGYLGATTGRIRFATHVLVLGYYHPLELAKRYGTLDRVTDGRLILGVGVGSLTEEFALLGAPFDDRGPRADEALAALRASLSQRQPEFHGTYYDYEGVIVDPCAQQDRVPIWIGGRTLRSLRRAVEHGDGWAPFSVDAARTATWLARVRDSEEWERRTTDLDIVLDTGVALDPLHEPEAARNFVSELAEAGATAVNARFRGRSLGEYLDQVAALAELRP